MIGKYLTKDTPGIAEDEAEECYIYNKDGGGCGDLELLEVGEHCNTVLSIANNLSAAIECARAKFNHKDIDTEEFNEIHKRLTRDILAIEFVVDRLADLESLEMGIE